MRFFGRIVRKRVLFPVLLLLVAVPIGSYWRATRPAALRARLQQTFRFIPHARIDAGSISFSFASGIRIRDLVVTSDAGQGELLRAEDVLISHDGWSFLLGRFRAVAIEASGIAATVVRDAASGKLNWHPDPIVETRMPHAADQPAEPQRPGTLRSIPRIHFRDVDLLLARDEDGRRRILRRSLFDVSGRLHEEEYRVELTHGGSGKQELGEIRWNLTNRSVRAELSWLSLETWTGLAPPNAARWLAALDGGGRVRLAGLEFARGAVRSATIEFTELAGGIPVSDADAALPATDRFLQLAAAHGFVRMDGRKVHVAAQGRLSDGHFDARLDVALDGTDPLHSGLSGVIELNSFSLPSFHDPRQRLFIDGLPPALFNFFEDFLPESRIDGRFLLSRDAGPDAEPSLAGRLSFLGGKCKYFRFPYQFDDVHGTVDFSPYGVTINNLTGRHGSARVTAHATLTRPRSFTGFDLTIRALDVPLDEDLYAALPNDDRALWNDVKPLGLCNLDIRINREEGTADTGPRKPRVRVDAELLSGSLSFGPDHRISHASGRVSIDSGVVNIHRLAGFVDDSPIVLRGEIHAPHGDARPAVALCANICDMPLTHAFDAGGGLRLDFNGLGDLWADIHRTPDGESDDALVAHVRDGRISAADGEAWTGVSGWVARSPEKLAINAFQARKGDAWLALTGALPIHAAESAAPLTLDLQMGDLPMESLPSAGLPHRWSTICRELGLTGIGRLSVHLKPVVDAASNVRQYGEIRLESQHMSPSILPLDFTDIRASLRVSETQCDILQAVGRQGAEGRVRLSGSVPLDPSACASELTISAELIRLNAEFVEAMPAGLREFLRQLSPNGMANVTLRRVRLDAGTAGAWSVEGELSLDDGRIDAGLLLDTFSGNLTGRVAQDSEGNLAVDARFAIQSGALAGRPVERWEGRLVQSTGSRVLHLEDVRGRLCGGEIVGEGQIDFEQKSYEISLTVHDVSFDQFLLRGGARRADAYEGRLDGHLFVRSRIGDVSSRSGGGDLRIRGASLLRTPVVRSVVEQRESGKLNESLDVAELRFALQADLVHLTRVDLQSRDLRLVGQGQWNMTQDSIDMTLVGAHPKNWPRVAVLTDLVEFAGREFMQYRLSGPSSQPRVVAEPLHGLTESIRRLLVPNP